MLTARLFTEEVGGVLMSRQFIFKSHKKAHKKHENLFSGQRRLRYFETPQWSNPASLSSTQASGKHRQ
jgi:hypothetical protein